MSNGTQQYTLYSDVMDIILVTIHPFSSPKSGSQTSCGGTMSLVIPP